MSAAAVEGADRKSATVTASPTPAIKRSFILKMELFCFKLNINLTLCRTRSEIGRADRRKGAKDGAVSPMEPPVRSAHDVHDQRASPTSAKPDHSEMSGFLLWAREPVKICIKTKYFHNKPPAIRVRDKSL